MSYHTFFNLTSGIKGTMTVPRGTKAYCLSKLAETESVLKIPRETYNGEVRWNHFDMDCGLGGGKDLEIPDNILCRGVEAHNRHVRWLYGRLGEWQAGKLGDKTEKLTTADAKEFWFGLETLSVKPERWTSDYYRERMEEVYEVMRGRPTHGISFNAKKELSPEQADAVICLFSEWLDVGDIRLAVPHGYDHLTASSDGGYHWCGEGKGACYRAIHGDEDGCDKKKCPLRAILNDEDEG